MQARGSSPQVPSNFWRKHGNDFLHSSFDARAGWTMRFARALVMLMSLECLTASACFAYSHNWRQAIYWLFAAGINAVAGTF